MRSKEPVKWDEVEIINKEPWTVPIIHNGDIFSQDEIVNCYNRTSNFLFFLYH